MEFAAIWGRPGRHSGMNKSPIVGDVYGNDQEPRPLGFESETWQNTPLRIEEEEDTIDNHEDFDGDPQEIRRSRRHLQDKKRIIFFSS